MLLGQLPTRLRRALYVFAAALAIIVALPLIDLVPVKQRIVHDASDSLGRGVAVGAVRFALLPSPNVTLEDVSMTEPDGRTPFARWESARFSLGWTALWRGRAELVDGRIQGLWISVKATSAGHFNIDDLLTRRPKSGRIDWRPQRVDLVGASLDWQDVDGRFTRLRNVDLHAINPETDDGAVTLQGQVSAPDWGGGLRLDSGLHIDRPHLTAQLPGFKLRINADVPDWREGHTDLNGDVVLSALPWRSRIDHAQVHAMAKHGDQLWQLAFDAAQLRLDERGFSTDALEGELGIKGVSRELAGRWKIQKLAANETGALVAQTADLHAQLLDEDQNAQMDLAGTLRISDWRRMTLDDYTLAGSYHNKALPRGAIKLALSGSAQLDLGRERLNWDSHGTLDGAPITTQFSLENFIDTKYVLGLDLGKLDLTPYLPSSDSKGPAIDTARKLNFSWLNDLDARADVKLGELDLGRFRVFNLQTHVEAGGRKLQLEPLSADIYGGRLTGKLTLDDTKTPRIQLRQSLKGMEIAALLSDTLGIDPLAGRGTVELDISAPATSVDAMRNGLSGDAQLTLARGYISGLDIGDALRGLHLGLADIVGGVMPPDNKRRTQFSNMSAHISFKDGVAESHDLNFRAPFLSMGGDGHVDLPHNRVDTVLRAKVLGGSGVAAFDALKGVVVPIEITGTLSSPHYHIDAHAIPERLSEPQRDAKAHG